MPPGSFTLLHFYFGRSQEGPVFLFFLPLCICLKISPAVYTTIPTFLGTTGRKWRVNKCKSQSTGSTYQFQEISSKFPLSSMHALTATKTLGRARATQCIGDTSELTQTSISTVLDSCFRNHQTGLGSPYSLLNPQRK